MRIGVVHFIGTGETIRVTADQADRLLDLANGPRRSDFVKIADRAFRPTSIDHIKFINGEAYDLTARPKPDPKRPTLTGGASALPGGKEN